MFKAVQKGFVWIMQIMYLMKQTVSEHSNTPIPNQMIICTLTGKMVKQNGSRWPKTCLEMNKSCRNGIKKIPCNAHTMNFILQNSKLSLQIWWAYLFNEVLLYQDVGKLNPIIRSNRNREHRIACWMLSASSTSAFDLTLFLYKSDDDSSQKHPVLGSSILCTQQYCSPRSASQTHGLLSSHVWSEP